MELLGEETRVGEWVLIYEWERGRAWRRGFVQCDRRPRHRPSTFYYVVNVAFSMKYFSGRRCFRRLRRGQATRYDSTREAPTSARVLWERAVRRALRFAFHTTCASRAGASGVTVAVGGPRNRHAAVSVIAWGAGDVTRRSGISF